MPFFILRAEGPAETRQVAPDSAGFATRAAAEEATRRLVPGQDLAILGAEDRKKAIRLLVDEAGIPDQPRLNTE